MSNRPQLFCSRPFRTFHVSGFQQLKGDVYLCCPSWLETPVGNIQRDTIEDMWNGEQARAIRRSILDGSFAYCNASTCPFLKTESGPVTRADRIDDPELEAVFEQQLTVLPHGPRELNCSYDRSCNLSCPTCRHGRIIETENEAQILAIQHKLDSGALSDVEYLYITGSGDAFGSPYFNRWLRTMRLDQFPRLQTIHLHTNGLLWTEKMWLMIPEAVRARITDAEISIDAASAATYAINRRGGEFERLLENLEFIGELRRTGALRFLKISMVVQANNFHEMPAFADMGKRYHADVVYFGKLVNWGTFTAAEVEQRAVHRAEHPEHPALLRVLGHEALSDPRVFLGNMADLRPAESPAGELGNATTS